MNHRDQLNKYLEDVASRSVDIAHTYGTQDRELRRFFNWGSQEAAMIGNYALNNTGWNLLVDYLPSPNVDNRHDYEARVFKMALMVLRKCDKQAGADINDRINKGWEIGWELLLHMRDQVHDRCNAEVNDMTTIPAVIEWPGIKHQEVAPIMFGGDAFYGYRFEVDFKYDREVPTVSDPSRWRTT